MLWRSRPQGPGGPARAYRYRLALRRPYRYRYRRWVRVDGGRGVPWVGLTRAWFLAHLVAFASEARFESCRRNQQVCCSLQRGQQTTTARPRLINVTTTTIQPFCVPACRHPIYDLGCSYRDVCVKDYVWCTAERDRQQMGAAGTRESAGSDAACSPSARRCRQCLSAHAGGEGLDDKPPVNGAQHRRR